MLGIGNTLLSDEGNGIHVIDYQRQHHPAPEGVTYQDGGTLSFTLAPEIEDTDHLIVVDAGDEGLSFERRPGEGELSEAAEAEPMPEELVADSTSLPKSERTGDSIEFIVKDQAVKPKPSG